MGRKYLYLLATDKKKGLVVAVLKAFLFLLSLIYGLVVSGLAFIYRIRPFRLNCKVISVGNITLGGTGKTSLVEMLARLLKSQGHKVAVLSRGYKSQAGLSTMDYAAMGDEPYMLSRNLGDVPVIADKNRVRAGKRAVRDYGADTVILDDGFQQWRIDKDLDIVTIDAVSPFGNLRLLPRGILREPLSSLRRADVFVLSKVNLNPRREEIKRFLKEINPHCLILEAVHKPVGFYKLGQSAVNLLGFEQFRGKPVSLLSGIADPASFEKLISNSGIRVGLWFEFPDHHPYSREDLNKVISQSKQKGINSIITTEKDSVRLPSIDYELSTMDCYVLRIELQILQYEIFIERIHSLY
jgi:tetraacyldisaccharide 4'-kinase